MPDIHVIPPTEKEQHEESPDCLCEPEPRIDIESGLMYWYHKILDWGDRFKGMFKI